MNEKPLPSPAARADEREETVTAAVATVVTGEPDAPATSATPRETLPVSFTHVTHEALFVDPALRCDVCDVPLTGDDRDDSEHAFAGRGLYVWIRGGQTVYEEPPLCAACGTAIGMTALARWDIEEEEG